MSLQQNINQTKTHKGDIFVKNIYICTHTMYVEKTTFMPLKGLFPIHAKHKITSYDAKKIKKE